MAESPAHRFGQIVGDVLRAAVLPRLSEFSKRHAIYLDAQGSRPCRRGLKCTWVDQNGNKHDLDFVLERGGTAEKVGEPVAFIEVAWRRYTKHSRNKVQEIQGAIEPLAQTYRGFAPFKGAILAGIFTEGALTQLSSLGFNIVYIAYDTVVATFRKYGIDITSTESTPDRDFQTKVDAYLALSVARKRNLARELVKASQSQFEDFERALSIAVLRQIKRVVILALHGSPREVTTIGDALRFVESYDEGSPTDKPVVQYEIQIRYSNGDSIDGRFKDKVGAVEFLRTYEPVSPKME